MATKKVMKRKSAQAVNHLKNAASDLFELREIFLPHHPEFTEFFDFAITTIGVLIGQLVKVFTLAWGHFPNDLTKWLH